MSSIGSGKSEVTMKRIKDEARDQVMSYKATMEERRLIEAQAKKQGVSPGAYMRGAVLMSLCMDGQPEAFAIVVDEMRQTFVERANAWKRAGLQKVREA